MEILTVLRKESIIFTTIDVIHEFGVQAVSTKEIARRAKISEGTIFRYFPKKHDLLLAVLEQFSIYDADLIQTTRIKRMEPLKAIRFYLESYACYYENYPAITAITQAYDILRKTPELVHKVDDILSRRAGFIRCNLWEAQLGGGIRQGVDCEVLTDLLTSLISGLCLKWRMGNYKDSLRGRLIQALNTIFEAFTAK